MPEQTVTIIREVWDFLKYAVIAVLGFFGWNLKRQIIRIDDLEKVHVTKEDLSALRNDIKYGFSEMKTDIRATHKRIDGLMKGVKDD